MMGIQTNKPIITQSGRVGGGGGGAWGGLKVT